MVFSSTLFLFYFLPLFLLVYWFVPQQAKNPVPLVASVLFHAWGGLDFLGLFLGSVIINFKQHQASH
jgi:alginate O-acetyltransferase complex protein AlgI